jgi:hypothetical protein
MSTSVAQVIASISNGEPLEGDAGLLIKESWIVPLRTKRRVVVTEGMPIPVLVGSTLDVLEGSLLFFCIGIR